MRVVDCNERELEDVEDHYEGEEEGDAQLVRVCHRPTRVGPPCNRSSSTATQEKADPSASCTHDRRAIYLVWQEAPNDEQEYSPNGQSSLPRGLAWGPSTRASKACASRCTRQCTQPEADDAYNASTREAGRRSLLV